MFMKDNKGFTLIELVVVIAIGAVILLTIFSFFTSGVKGYSRGITTANNQTNVRRVSNEIAKQIRRSSAVEITNPTTLTLSHASGEEKTIIKFNSGSNTIEAKYYDISSSGIETLNRTGQLAERIGNFTVAKTGDKTTVTVESIENTDGHVEKLETVLTKRK